MDSSFVQSRGGCNYGDVIPPTDWNTVIMYLCVKSTQRVMDHCNRA